MESEELAIDFMRLTNFPELSRFLAQWVESVTHRPALYQNGSKNVTSFYTGVLNREAVKNPKEFSVPLQIPFSSDQVIIIFSLLFRMLSEERLSGTAHNMLKTGCTLDVLERLLDTLEKMDRESKSTLEK